MFHARLVYDKKAVCQSRVCDDYVRTINVDEKGDEHITFDKVDYKKLQDSLGDFEKWSLKSLVAAGIDPDFGIKTGYGTRMEGLGAVEDSVNKINEVIDSVNKGE